MRMMRRGPLEKGAASAAFLSLLVLFGVPVPARAQEYPAKPVRLIVPFPAGSTDIFARAFAQRAALGQPVVVENVPGANGAIGLTRTARSAPDGYTLSIGATTTLVVSPHINLKLSYDPLRDFVPIAMLARIPSVLVINASVPAKSIAELVALAKENPGKLNFGSIGTGSTGHMLGEMLRRAAGIDIVHVPYKGNAPGVTALLAGEVQLFFFPAFVDAMQHLRSGRLRALGVADSHRSPVAPEVATLPQLGYPRLVAPAWYALLAPAGTPNAVVQRLAAEVQRVYSLDAMKRFLADQGAESGQMAPEEIREFMAAEYARYGRMVRETGIQAE